MGGNWIWSVWKVFGLKTGVNNSSAESIYVIENSMSSKPYNQLTWHHCLNRKWPVTAQLVFGPSDWSQKQQLRDLTYLKVLGSTWAWLASHWACFSWRWTELMVLLCGFYILTLPFCVLAFCIPAHRWCSSFCNFQAIAICDSSFTKKRVRSASCRFSTSSPETCSHCLSLCVASGRRCLTGFAQLTQDVIKGVCSARLRGIYRRLMESKNKKGTSLCSLSLCLDGRKRKRDRWKHVTEMSNGLCHCWPTVLDQCKILSCYSLLRWRKKMSILLWLGRSQAKICNLIVRSGLGLRRGLHACYCLHTL